MRTFLRRFSIVVAGIVALLLLVRFVGSPIATHFANKKLAAMPQFTGHVDAVQLAMWRGTVTVRNLELSDRSHPEDGVIVRVPHGMLSVAWAPFFRGRIGGEGSVENLDVLMVKRAKTVKDEEEKAKKLAKPMLRAWQNVLAKQFPIEFSKITTKNGKLRFDDRSSPGVVNLTIDNIDITMTGFTNRREGGNVLPATVQMHAILGGSGNLVVFGRADPSQRQPTFDIRMELKGLSLPQIRAFLVRYALVDVSSGEFNLYTEVNAAHGAYDGYTKPFFKDLKFKAVPDPE
ncbi:MAG TPA: DUF748 domain-containing protein, partial [Candidatus Didemnitutus sp.]|nr:DUF748 domain-containing protein [Candidatus Didemnitutus sp.]